jgi:hypothetical protein
VVYVVISSTLLFLEVSLDYKFEIFELSSMTLGDLKRKFKLMKYK